MLKGKSFNILCSIRFFFLKIRGWLKMNELKSCVNHFFVHQLFVLSLNYITYLGGVRCVHTHTHTTKSRLNPIFDQHENSLNTICVKNWSKRNTLFAVIYTNFVWGEHKKKRNHSDLMEISSFAYMWLLTHFSAIIYYVLTTICSSFCKLATYHIECDYNYHCHRKDRMSQARIYVCCEICTLNCICCVMHTHIQTEWKKHCEFAFVLIMMLQHIPSVFEYFI